LPDGILPAIEIQRNQRLKKFTIAADGLQRDLRFESIVGDIRGENVSEGLKGNLVRGGVGISVISAHRPELILRFDRRLPHAGEFASAERIHGEENICPLVLIKHHADIAPDSLRHKVILGFGLSEDAENVSGGLIEGFGSG
jgi:hypothetical protein